MRLENLVPYIVPLTFLAMYAITWVFNRETQSIPPRAASRPAGGNPSRPDAAPQQRPPLATEVRRLPTPREMNLPRRNPSTQSRPPAASGEGISFESTTRRPAVDPNPRRNSPATRRPNRAAAAAPARELNGKRPDYEPTVRPTFGTRITGSTVQTHTQSPALTPLTLPPSPLLSDYAKEAEGTDESRERAAEPLAITGLDVRKLVTSPARIRESIIIGELLKPPLALRFRPDARR